MYTLIQVLVLVNQNNIVWILCRLSWGRHSQHVREADKEWLIQESDKYQAYSDFIVDFTANVAGSHVSGYLLNVYPAVNEDGDSEIGPLQVLFLVRMHNAGLN